jgi:hypothetical protein
VNFIDPKTLTIEVVEQLWVKAQSVPQAFDERIKDRADIFVHSLFENSLYIDVLGKGLVQLSSIFLNAEATVHTVIWDRSEPHKIISCMREILQFLFTSPDLGFRRLTTFTGANNTEVIRLIELLGFTFEGRLRKAFMYEGDYHDTLVYGILKEEILTKEM